MRPHVYCICDGTSFPIGEATNNRILMVGKALKSRDMDFSVYVNCRSNRQPANVNVDGVYNDIPFYHVNGSMKMSRNLITNGFHYYIRGFYRLLVLIRSLAGKHNHIIYLYSQGTVLNAFVSSISSFYKIPVVQEVNEWTEAVDTNFLRSFIYKKIMFRWSVGAMVISNNILHRVNQNKGKRVMQVLRVPILGAPAAHSELQKENHFLWCGQVDGYIKDVIFLIKSFSKVCLKTDTHTLIICGKFKSATGREIKALMKKENIPDHLVLLPGFVSNSRLQELIDSATALLVPMWEDQRSLARFPTKIVSFLFSGNPVITCGVGEINNYLQDGDNAVFYKPGDSSDLSMKLLDAVGCSSEYKKIGKNGRKVAEEEFNVAKHAKPIADLFFSCLEESKPITLKHKAFRLY